MKLLTKEILKKLPKRYSQENEKDPIVICKFFDPTGSWTWYAIEGEQDGDDFIFFGLVKGFESELGYFSLRELETCKNGMRGLQALPIERDINFKPCRLSEIK
jgi:hypothetical protein